MQDRASNPEAGAPSERFAVGGAEGGAARSISVEKNYSEWATRPRGAPTNKPAIDKVKARFTQNKDQLGSLTS